MKAWLVLLIAIIVIGAVLALILTKPTKPAPKDESSVLESELQETEQLNQELQQLDQELNETNLNEIEDLV